MDSRTGEMMPATSESIGGLAGALWRRRLWILVPTLLAFLLAMATVNLLTPRYTGEARVLLENRDTVYSRPDRDLSPGNAAIDPEAVASQVQNVMSKDLALDIIREMGLARRAEYDPVQKGLGLSGTVLVLLGLQKDPRQIPQEERVLEMYYKRLLAYPLGKSRVIAIEFQSEDPKVAADVANRIAEEYLRREEGAKNQTSRATSDWLDKAIEPLMRKVVAAESRVEAFRASKGLFVGANNTSISTQQLAELNTQLSAARAQQADLQARARLIREALRLGKVFETSEVINNELVRRLLEQRAALKAQIAFEERTLLPGHPRMKELGGQLADLEGQVRAAAERAARALDNDARAAGARVASMQAELDSQKKTTALSNEDEVQLKALEREALALREQLNSYRNKFLDAAARASENAQPADARVISRAFPQSDPTFPKKIPIVLLATLGTFVIASTLVAAQVLMARQALPAHVDPEYGVASPFLPAMPAPPAMPEPAAPEPDPLPWEASPSGWRAALR
ncbi:MAG: GumC family protein, partial [Hyphomicrobiales bacterium]|nr:GumC family protein [Hyphomicrobiales bacterium]